jgi:GTP-binding protein
MSISVNKSPLAGREGKLLQSRVIRDRLFKELDRNVALKVRASLTLISHIVDCRAATEMSLSNDI